MWKRILKVAVQVLQRWAIQAHREMRLYLSIPVDTVNLPWFVRNLQISFISHSSLWFYLINIYCKLFFFLHLLRERNVSFCSNIPWLYWIGIETHVPWKLFSASASSLDLEFCKMLTALPHLNLSSEGCYNGTFRVVLQLLRQRTVLS